MGVIILSSFVQEVKSFCSISQMLQQKKRSGNQFVGFDFDLLFIKELCDVLFLFLQSCDKFSLALDILC